MDEGEDGVGITIRAGGVVEGLLILDEMALRCHRINSKAMNLKNMRTILNLLHEKGLYFIESNH